MKTILNKLDYANSILLILLGFSIATTVAGTNIIAALILLLFVISGNYKEKFNIIRKNPIALSALLLLLLFVLAMSYSVSDHQHMTLIMSKFAKLILIPVTIYLARDHNIKKWCLRSFCLAMIITLILAYIRFNTGWPIYTSTGAEQYKFDIFLWHISTNMLMAFATICFAVFMTQTRPLWQQLAFFLLTVASTYYVLGMNTSRSSYVTLAAMIVWLIIFLLKHKQFKNILLVGIAFFIGISLTLGFSYNFYHRINTAQSNVQNFHKNHRTSVGYRLEFYTNTLKLIENRPIFGYGTAGFAPAYKKAFVTKINGIGATHNPHNQYLDIMTQLGIIGLIAFLLLLFTTAKTRDEKYNIFMHSVLITMVVGSLFNSWLMDFTPGFFFCYFVGVFAKTTQLRAN